MGAPPHLLLRKRSSFLFLLPHPSPPPLKIIQHLIIMWVEIISDSYDDNPAETPLSAYFFHHLVLHCVAANRLFRVFKELCRGLTLIVVSYFWWNIYPSLKTFNWALVKTDTWILKLTLIWAMEKKYLCEYYSKMHFE